MQVIRAKVLGYCMGVRKAVDAARKALDDYSDKENTSVYSFGPLIHNPIALNMLSQKGLKVLDGSDTCVQQLSGDVTNIVVIRAHGISPRMRAQLEEKNSLVIDATCPRVTLSQRRSAEFARNGYLVIITGDKNHGEVTGIAGCTEDEQGVQHCITIQNEGEATSLVEQWNKSGTVPEKALLLSQTTFSSVSFAAICDILKPVIPQLEICNTICSATRQRQDALQELSGQVEGILVVGGKNSANTTRLFQTAQKLCKTAAFIETADAIPEAFFHLNKVGITAGASTPDEVIDAVEQRLLDNAAVGK